MDYHADPHMVGYEIEHLSETVVAERRRHLTEGHLIAELRVQLAMVDDVVAMRAAGTRFQVRRGVNVTDAQSRQVGSEGCGILETEPLVKL